MAISRYFVSRSTRRGEAGTTRERDCFLRDTLPRRAELCLSFRELK